MSDDLIQRLRSSATSDPILVEAADEIERLRSAYERGRRDGLEEAAGDAKVGWLVSKRDVIGDADRECALCEEIAAAIRAKIDTKP